MQQTEKMTSLQNAQRIASSKRDKEKMIDRYILAANHKTIWYVGLFFALFPVGVSLILMLLRMGSADSCAPYAQFLADFCYGGSLLWLSLTLIGTSLLELLLSGFRRSITKEARARFKLVLILCLIAFIIGVVVFVENISEPFPRCVMPVLSGVYLVSFVFVSWIVSFCYVKEV